MAPIERIYVVVHKNDARYLGSFPENTANLLRTLSAAEITCHHVESLEELQFQPGSVILASGNFIPRQKAENCLYVCFNWSVLFNLNARIISSWRAWRWIKERRRLLMKKAPYYHAVLDYYPSQTPRLAKLLSRYPINVMPFLVDMNGPEGRIKAMRDRRWDICAVGSPSPRRMKAFADLERAGCSLSPMDTTRMDSILGDSKLTLNIHFERCDNLESPRLIPAFRLGSCVVTESCYGLDGLVPPRYYCAGSYRNLVPLCRELLREPDRMDAIAESARLFVETTYRKRCLDSWKAILNSLEKMQIPPTDTPRELCA